MPKLVNLNTRSMIHIIFGRISGLALKHAINNGTSAVLWWLAMISVLVSRFWHGDISSPNSTTKFSVSKEKIEKSVSKIHVEGMLTVRRNAYDRIRLSMTTSPPPTIANEIAIPQFWNINRDDTVWLAAASSSIPHTLEYNRCYSISQWLFEIWPSDIGQTYCREEEKHQKE